MKLTAILLTIACLHADAKSFGQVVSLSVKNAPPLQVFNEVEKQTGYTFIYAKEQAERMKFINLNVVKADLVTVLNLIFNEDQLFTYVISGRYIAINEKTAKSSQNQSLSVADVMPVSGRITDDGGKPLEGVSVVLKTSGKGTKSKSDGSFSIGVPEGGDILVFSYVGFEVLEINVKKAGQLAIKMKPVINSGQEIVVLGYGRVKKRDLTGSVSSIGATELKEQPISSFNQALQGRVSGVQITNASNAPGGGITVRVRGGNSISASNDPLYVIDGFPVSNPGPASGLNNATAFPNPLAAINPNDIESIEVLKDASATAIYGSRGANGVVLVTTKRGKDGQSNIDFEVYYGIQQITKKLDLVTAEQHTAAKNEQLRNLGFPERYGNSSAYPLKPAEYGKGTDWQDEIYRSAAIKNYQLSFYGGSDKLRYMVSANLFDQEGIVIASNFKRYSARLNLDAKVNDRIKIGTNFIVSRNYNNGVSEVGLSGLVGLATTISPASPVFDANGNYQLLNVGPGSGFNSYANPVAVANTSTNLSVTDRVIGNIFSDISLAKGLTARISLGADVFSNRRNIFYTPQTLLGNTANGMGSNGTASNLNILNENTLTYSKTTKYHAVDVVAGVTFQHNREERSAVEAQDFPNYSLGSNNLALANKPLPPSGSIQEWGLNSYLGRLNYRFKDRYLFTVTGRMDGSSRFGANNKYGFFPSGAFAWRISDEPFLNENKIIRDLKLRISYGITGNDGIGLYNSLSSYGTGRTNFGNTEVLTSSASRIANPDLRWEKTGQFDVGLDVGILNNRIQVTADYYIKTTKDLLLGVELPATTGFTSVTRNVGSLENRGFEIGLNTVNLNGIFKWKTSGNISFNTNKVLKLNDATEFFVSSTQNTSTSIVRIGQPVGSFYGNVFDGIWQTQDEITKAGARARAGDLPGAIKYKDLNDDGIFNEATDRTILGNGIPKIIYGLTNNFMFKGFNLSVFLQGVQGNSIYNFARRSMETSDPSAAILKSVVENAWRADKPSNTNPSIRQWRPTGTDSYYLEDGSFLRVKNVLLGYQLPLKIQFIKSARVYISGQNLFTVTKYRGYDPEVNSDFNSNTSYGVDAYAYPAARTITFGANLTF
ncbi:MAG TPA: TonB-dependent receptor [Chitinophagaceae bacterium]|nr:TonB-dependent receptor [Chitinophagaceae bacterium]